ncbi:hypothetical protein [Marinicella marina]|uniref:hypothetical protein n=1 Tax=Marinicella marina TaxID=2996016 RepID=UPI0024BC07A1|nr:hypothetical protein [Marinicella marina]MDJ1139614.1 hypothetical protein [Marinicella marina]
MNKETIFKLNAIGSDFNKIRALTIQDLIDCYLEYFNDFLTLGGFADAYGLTEDNQKKGMDTAKLIIDLGRRLHKELTT